MGIESLNVRNIMGAGPHWDNPLEISSIRIDVLGIGNPDLPPWGQKALSHLQLVFLSTRGISKQHIRPDRLITSRAPFKLHPLPSILLQKTRAFKNQNPNFHTVVPTTLPHPFFQSGTFLYGKLTQNPSFEALLPEHVELWLATANTAQATFVFFRVHFLSKKNIQILRWKTSQLSIIKLMIDNIPWTWNELWLFDDFRHFLLKSSEVPPAPWGHRVRSSGARRAKHPKCLVRYEVWWSIWKGHRECGLPTRIWFYVDLESTDRAFLCFNWWRFQSKAQSKTWQPNP